MSKRIGGEKQEDIWIAHRELARAPGHPFYERLNELLEGAGFEPVLWKGCARGFIMRGWGVRRCNRECIFGRC